MGRHSTRKSNNAQEKAHPILRGFFIAIATIVTLTLVGGFGYAKYLEAKLRNYPQNEQVQKVMAKPIGNEPINILVMGSDARIKGEHARSDTIIVLRLIPEEKRMLMLSIPRDLRVMIPENGMNKINAAHAYGGPELAIRTVQSFTGLDVHHYIEVQFEGFKRIVDALGGVTINVEKPLVNKETKFGIAAGVQRMNGDLALNYCRFRKDAYGDFGRMERQQKFFRAVIDESMKFRSMFKLPSVINIIAENTQTDMSTGEMLSIASFVVRLDKDNVETATIPGDSKMINGVSYVIGDNAKIMEMLTKIKNDELLNPKESAAADTKTEKGAIKSQEDVELRNQDITIAVQNGCGENGIAKVLSDQLEAEKFSILEEPKNADGEYLNTTIYYKPGMKKRADMIAEYFKQANLESNNGNVKSAAQVVIVIGKDHRKVLKL